MWKNYFKTLKNNLKKLRIIIYMNSKFVNSKFFFYLNNNIFKFGLIEYFLFSEKHLNKNEFYTFLEND